MKFKIAIAALVAPLALGMTACDMPESPCASLELTDREQKIADLGGEVERSVGDTECEYNGNGSWSEDH